MSTTEITTGQKAKATLIGIHSASTGLAISPVVKAARFTGRSVKAKYDATKAAKVEQYAEENASKPIVAEPISNIPQGVTTF